MEISKFRKKYEKRSGTLKLDKRIQSWIYLWILSDEWVFVGVRQLGKEVFVPFVFSVVCSHFRRYITILLCYKQILDTLPQKMNI